MPKLDFEELLKPRIITCAQCSEGLHIIPIKKDLGKGRFSIETINICGKYTFKKG